MKDLPVELVDMVVEELLDLVGTPNSYSGSRCDQRHSDGISRYSTVSKRWANLTREHHFETVCFDKPAMLKRWTTCIPADPDGVSRYVRDLALNQVDPSELEKHLHAFTNLESLSFFKCEGVLQLPFIKDWFTLVGGSLVELRLSVLLTPQHIIASLLAELPVLEILDTYELGFPGEQDEPTPADPPRIPFFEGDNQFILYFAIRVGWVPPNPQFGQLEMDTHSLRKVLEVVKPPSRWFASSSTTLKDLVITADEGDTHIFDNEVEPTSLDLSPCNALESLSIPMFPFAEFILPNITSLRLAKVSLALCGQDPAAVGDGSWTAIGMLLYSLAKRYKDANPGRKMEVEISEKIQDPAKLDEFVRGIEGKEFVSRLKEEAEVHVGAV